MNTTPQRIYIVTNKLTSGQPPRLVRAVNSAQALRHVCTDTFAVDVATQDDLVIHVEAGVRVEKTTPYTPAKD